MGVSWFLNCLYGDGAHNINFYDGVTEIEVKGGFPYDGKINYDKLKTKKQFAEYEKKTTAFVKFHYQPCADRMHFYWGIQNLDKTKTFKMTELPDSEFHTVLDAVNSVTGKWRATKGAPKRKNNDISWHKLM